MGDGETEPVKCPYCGQPRANMVMSYGSSPGFSKRLPIIRLVRLRCFCGASWAEGEGWRAP